jgi:hypothetical protein
MLVRARHAAVVVCFLTFGWLPSQASASSIPIGLLSFNEIIPPDVDPPDVGPGVNAFTIDNFTGAAWLPDPFPVTTPVTLLNASLTLTSVQDGQMPAILLGDIGPGLFTSLALEFPSDKLFTSAVLTATLSPTLLDWDDGLGNTGAINVSAQITATLLPLATELQPGEFVIIEAVEAAVTVPEPAEPTSLLLITICAVGVAASLRRKRRVDRTAAVS